MRTKEFSNVVEYKINIQKSIVFLYASKEQFKEDSKETFPFKISSKRGDFPGGPVVKTPRSQCRGPGFNPCSGN